MGSCFPSSSLDAAYADGRWVSHSTSPPYRADAAIYKPAGLKISAATAQHYGRCDDVSPNRQLYEWRPLSCLLEPFSRDSSCELLRGKQLLFAGDSTMWQLFLSFVMLHGGYLGRNLVHTSSASDISASACNDRVRAVFVRSDLLLWSNHHWEYTQARRTDTTVKGGSFIQRSIEADLVLYGLGHHFPRIMDRAEKMGALEQQQSRRAFFLRNLNYTLASTIAHRARFGRHPATVTLIGTSSPVSGCSRFARPISLADSLGASAEERELNQYNVRWQMMPRFNRIAKWLAADLGASFLDVAAISAQRPDAAMARFWPKAGSLDEDCLHYCMPGPIDTWTRLLHGHWLRLAVELGMPASAVDGVSRSGSGGGWHEMRPRAFFASNMTRWLGERNAANSIERCGPRASLPGLACIDSIVSRHWWWPFFNNTKKPTPAVSIAAVTVSGGSTTTRPSRKLRMRGLRKRTV